MRHLACGNGTALPNHSESPHEPSNRSRSAHPPASSPGLSRPVQGGLTVAALVLVPSARRRGERQLPRRTRFHHRRPVAGVAHRGRRLGPARHRPAVPLHPPAAHRQGIHRATAVASLGFLLLHVTVKIALGHVSLIGALIPFGLGVTRYGRADRLRLAGRTAHGRHGRDRRAAQRLVAATRRTVPGPEAGTLAARCTPWPIRPGAPRWSTACTRAGRAATWVVVMYSLCLIAVAAALCLRLLPRPTKRRITDRITALMSRTRTSTRRTRCCAGPRGRARSAGPAGTASRPRRTPSRGAPRDRAGPGHSGAPAHPVGAAAPRRCPRPYRCPARCTRPPTAPLYGVQSPAYEPPPRSSDRLADGPVGGPGAGPGIGSAARSRGSAGRRSRDRSVGRAGYGRIPCRLPGR